MISSLIKGLWGIFGGTCLSFAQFFKYAMQAAKVVVFIMCINTVNLVMQSGLEGDVEVWAVDPETKQRVLFKVTGRKTLPPNLALNMLSINFNHDLDRQIDYKRHVYSLGGINLYVGGGLSQSTIKGIMDTKYHLGITVTL